MPFTPVHIIAILPLAWWKRIPFSALAIGCMIPDLPLFVDVVDYAQTHSPVEPVTTCWPIGLVVFVIFQSMLKTPLWDLLPSWIKRRTQPLAAPTISLQVSFWLFVSAAIIVGAYSHIAWDSFTHKDRIGTVLIPALNSNLEFFGRELPIYKCFQYGSTLIGLPFLTILAGWKLYRCPVSDKEWSSVVSNLSKRIALAILLVMLIIACGYSLINYDHWNQRIVKSVTNSGLAAAIWSLVYAGYYHWFSQPNGPENSHPLS